MSHFDQPPPHGIVRNWLGAAEVERLLAYAKANRDSFKDSGIGYGENARVDPARRVSRKLKQLGALAPDLEAKVHEALPRMFQATGCAPFVPKHLELELVAHGDGPFFARHSDTFWQKKDAQSHRVISGVYYFHAQPKAFSGGVLRLHSLSESGRPGTFVDVEPENDTLVFFPSWFPHEVQPVVCPSGRFEDSRFAINCWVHRS